MRVYGRTMLALPPLQKLVQSGLISPKSFHTPLMRHHRASYLMSTIFRTFPRLLQKVQMIPLHNLLIESFASVIKPTVSLF